MPKQRAQPEYEFQCEIVKLLRLILGGNSLAFHIPNGGVRNIGEARRLKRAGVLAGVSDLCILDSGRAHFIELKAGRGQLSEAQREFQAAAGRAGCPSAVVRTVDDLFAALREWGIALKHNISSRPLIRGAAE